jgi:hypothetical protein
MDNFFERNYIKFSETIMYTQIISGLGENLFERFNNPDSHRAVLGVDRRGVHQWREKGAYLIRKSPCIAETNLLDKGYDSNKTHALFRNKGKYSIIPARKGCVRGKYRKEMRNYFDYGQYWQRNIAESIISAIKRKFSASVSSKHIKTQTAQVYARLILHNLCLDLTRLFHLSQIFRNFFKY